MMCTGKYRKPVWWTLGSHESKICGKGRMYMARIVVGNRTYFLQLEDNETARAFSALFPLTLEMTELNGNEKYHNLLGPLPCAPEIVNHISAGDVMLFGDRCVVVFYKSFATPYTYTRLGHIVDPQLLSEAVGEGSVQVHLEEP